MTTIHSPRQGSPRTKDYRMGTSDFLPVSSLLLACACAGISAWRPTVAAALAVWMWSSDALFARPSIVPAIALVLCSVDLLQPILLPSASLARVRYPLGMISGIAVVALLSPGYDGWLTVVIAGTMGPVSVHLYAKAQQSMHAMLHGKVGDRGWELVRSIMSGILAFMTLLFPLMSILVMSVLAMRASLRADAENG